MSVPQPSFGVLVVSAWDALEPARVIARLLGAEGYDVSIAAGRSALADLNNAERTPRRLVVVWSLDGASSPWVWPWINAAQPDDPIVEIEIAKGVAPELESRTQHVIDFSGWRGERAGEAWKTFEDRVRLAVYGKPPPPSVRKTAGVVFGVLAVGVATTSGVMRLAHEGTTTAGAATPAQVAAVEAPPAAPMGGPEALPADLDAPEFQRGRIYRARALTLPEAPTELASADMVDPMTFRDRSLLDALTERFRNHSDDER